MEKAVRSPPLVVDLDGTLVKTDLLYEALCQLLKRHPLYVFMLPFWLWKGKAYVKHQIARSVKLGVETLPYHEQFLDYLKAQHARGRPLVLATAANERLAQQVADYLQLFETVFASDQTTNLSGERKRDRLVAAFGLKGFDYTGNDWRDLPVWTAARKAIVVEASDDIRAAAVQVADVERVFESSQSAWKPYVRAIRVHQWLKNLLVFVPLLTAQGVLKGNLVVPAIWAFLAFGLCASSVYLLNDLLDLAADRQHPQKRHRPFASGELPIKTGLLLIPVLLGLSGAISVMLPVAFLGVLGMYYATTMAYSFALKRFAPLDVLILAGLYTLRMIAGSAATGLWPSYWLLAFTSFLFLSLALVKRYAEVMVSIRTVGEPAARARSYRADDRELLSTMGVASGYLAVLVLALYITTETAQEYFGQRELIWFVCPLLLYWVSYVWLVAHRGGMYDDPVVFAVKDRISLITLTGMALVFLMTTQTWW
jgi:4-hydroxybenzoate polyprenyltransferase/phosphoglycolate phosphatase-like HAD superfamily hydrolase